MCFLLIFVSDELNDLFDTGLPPSTFVDLLRSVQFATNLSSRSLAQREADQNLQIYQSKISNLSGPITSTKRFWQSLKLSGAASKAVIHNTITNNDSLLLCNKISQFTGDNSSAEFI